MTPVIVHMPMRARCGFAMLAPGCRAETCVDLLIRRVRPRAVHQPVRQSLLEVIGVVRMFIAVLAKRRRYVSENLFDDAVQSGSRERLA